MTDPIMTTLIRDGVLDLGDIQLDCYIARDDQGKLLRLLSQRKLVEALGRRLVGGGGHGVQSILRTGALENYVTASLTCFLQPYTWKTSRGIHPKAYRAELLAEICELYLCARDAGVLHPWQVHIAERCDKMMRAFARVGIVALVDEATGFQEDRPKDMLRELYAIFLQEQPDVMRTMYTEEFFRVVFKLYGRPYHPRERPPLFAGFISRAVYKHIPDPLYEWVKEKNPVIRDDIQRRYRHHQFFKDGEGTRLIRRQIDRVIDAANGVGCRKDRLEEFWGLLNNMCGKAGVKRRAWETTQLDMGFDDLPMFSYVSSPDGTMGRAS